MKGLVWCFNNVVFFLQINIQSEIEDTGCWLPILAPCAKFFFIKGPMFPKLDALSVSNWALHGG